MSMGTRRGQALTELAVGMFTIALLASVVCAFTVYIVKSLRMQNSVRSASPEGGAVVEVDDFAARHALGTTQLTIDNWKPMPLTSILK